MRGDELFHHLEAENPLAPEVAAEIDTPYLLAANVHRIRKALGMSQEALASALGVTQPRIAQIERGDANLRIGTLARLAVALRCDPRDLLLAPDLHADSGATPLRKGRQRPRRVA
jgi:transcriptional regulator with XRE-family HTH domain